MPISSCKTEIIVRSQFKGMHKWADCPIEDVAFLKDLHRHVFHVELAVSVTHPDRDIEFFMLQRLLETALYNLYREESSLGYFMLGSRSCEMIAKEIIDFMVEKYDVPSSEITCSVFEDAENGAKVTWSLV